MRRKFGQSLRLGVAADGLALLRVGGWPRAGAEVMALQAVEAGAPDALGKGLRALLDACDPRGWPLVRIRSFRRRGVRATVCSSATRPMASCRTSAPMTSSEARPPIRPAMR